MCIGGGGMEWKYWLPSKLEEEIFPTGLGSFCQLGSHWQPP